MAYSHTENVPNGDSFTLVDYYKCDITNVIFCESDGWYGNDIIHISEKGVEILLEDWIKRNSYECGIPAILKYLEIRLTNRRKPNKYISKKIRKNVLLKYKHKCVKCGSIEKLEIDHIKPVSKGGLSQFKNLQILCKACNVKKSNK